MFFKKKRFLFSPVLGIKTPGKHSTTELYPQPQKEFFKVKIIVAHLEVFSRKG
jgi:hypothetical protein